MVSITRGAGTVAGYEKNVKGFLIAAIHNTQSSHLSNWTNDILHWLEWEYQEGNQEDSKIQQPLFFDVLEKHILDHIFL